MTGITIPLTDQRLEQLKVLAQKAGVSPEEWARVRLEEWLNRSCDDFTAAAGYVLEKNSELYRRLS